MTELEQSWVDQIDATIDALVALKDRISQGEVIDVKWHTDDEVRAMVHEQVAKHQSEGVNQ